MTAFDLLKELERDFHLQLSGSRHTDIANRIEKWRADEREAERQAVLAEAAAAIASRPAIPFAPKLVTSEEIPNATE